MLVSSGATTPTTSQTDPRMKYQGLLLTRGDAPPDQKRARLVLLLGRGISIDFGIEETTDLAIVDEYELAVVFAGQLVLNGPV